MAGFDWAKMVTDLRKESGLSQRALAEKANVGRTTVGKIEKGSTHLPIHVLEKILDALGYELDAILKNPNNLDCNSTTTQQNS